MARGEHLCMSMRGIKTPATMTTSVLRGIFRHSSDDRMEFLTLVLEGGRKSGDETKGLCSTGLVKFLG